MDHQGSPLHFCYLSSQSVMLCYIGPRTLILLLTRLTHRQSWQVLDSSSQGLLSGGISLDLPCPPSHLGVGAVGRVALIVSCRAAHSGQTNSPLKHPWDSSFSLGSRLTAGPAPAQKGLVSPSAGTWSQVWAPLICTTSGPQPT